MEVYNNFDQKCIAFSSKKHHSLKWDTLQFPPIYPSQRHNWPSSLEIIIFQNLEIFKIINISKKKTKNSIFPENFQTHRGTTTQNNNMARYLVEMELANLQKADFTIQETREEWYKRLALSRNTLVVNVNKLMKALIRTYEDIAQRKDYSETSLADLEKAKKTYEDKYSILLLTEEFLSGCVPH